MSWRRDEIAVCVNGREISEPEIKLLVGAIIDDALGRWRKALRVEIGLHVRRCIDKLRGRIVDY
jgi:hypothetical protein